MRFHSSFPKSHIIYTIAIIGFIYTVHQVLPTYSNSSFLGQFFSDTTIGVIYMLSAAITVFAFLFTPTLLRKIGNYTTIMWCIVIQIVLFYVLSRTASPSTVALAFILQGAVASVIGLCLDIFLEVYSGHKNVGNIRGMYLTVMNTAWITTPIIGSLIISSNNNYRDVYLASLFVLIPLLYLVYKNFPRFHDPHYTHPSFWQSITIIGRDRDQSRLFLANIILQIFYAWMVVYSPIYLNREMGFNWVEIGLIITIMLIPFPLLEWPLGKISDGKFGEREIMSIGFLIIGISTIALSTILSKNVWTWAAMLFVTRIGAASVESMIEVYFFKKVNQRDSGLLGLFRITRPLAYFAAPAIVGVTLLYSGLESSQFISLGVLCLLAIIPASTLKDTN